MLHRTHRAEVFAGVVLLALCGCVSNEAGKAELPSARGECVDLKTADSYRVLDDKRILLGTNPKKIIEVYSDCFGLRFAEDIGLEGSGGQVCDYRGDKVIVDGRRCTIASIEEYGVDADYLILPRLELNSETF